MKHIKPIIFSFLVFWIIGLYLTFTPNFFWYAYFFISAVAVLLAIVLIIYLNPDLYYDIEDFIFKILRKEPKQFGDDDYEDDYYMILRERRRQEREKKKRKKKKKKKRTYDITSLRQRKDTHSDYIIVNTSSANIRHKEYLHTTISDIDKGEKQELLFETILSLKESRFFSISYAGLSDEDLINNFNEYKNRRIFELYDNIIPNAYAKVVYDQKSKTNRLNIFIPNNQNRDADYSLGFIAIEDSYKAEVLVNKYTNIQVIPTIIGGAYKQAYKDDNGNINIKTGFVPYSLTISLAFYNL